MMVTINILFICSSLLFSVSSATTTPSWDQIPTYAPYDVFGYVDAIGQLVNNDLIQNGLNLKLDNVTFNVDSFLYTVNLVGTVYYTNGLVTEFGYLNRSFVVVEGNRSEDLTTASLSFGLTVHQLNLTYNVVADIEDGLEKAIYYVYFDQVDFFFVVNHTYSSNLNHVVPEQIETSEQDQHYVPRTVVMYAVEQVTANNTGVDNWFGADLISWHEDVLTPIVEQQADRLTFPISPH